MRMLRLAPSSASLKLTMKPSSFKMRAISILSLEAGTSTLGWRADCALRMRVSMSAMGSVMAMFYSGAPFLPARFDHARDLARDGELTKTNPAQVKFPNVAARPAATETAVAEPDFHPGRGLLVRGLVGGHDGPGLVFFGDLRCGCHVFLYSSYPLYSVLIGGRASPYALTA